MKKPIVLSQSLLIAQQAVEAALELRFGNRAWFKDYELLSSDWMKSSIDKDTHHRTVAIKAHFMLDGDRTYALHSVDTTIKIWLIDKGDVPTVRIMSELPDRVLHMMLIDGRKYRAYFQGSPRTLKMQSVTRDSENIDDWAYTQDFDVPPRTSKEELAKIWD